MAKNKISIEELKEVKTYLSTVLTYARTTISDEKSSSLEFFALIYDLIDAEIDRRSMGDGDLALVENFVKSLAYREVDITEKLMRTLGERSFYWHLIIDALRTYNKVLSVYTGTGSDDDA